MKKALIVTLLAALTLSSTGCTKVDTEIEENTEHHDDFESLYVEKTTSDTNNNTDDTEEVNNEVTSEIIDNEEDESYSADDQTSISEDIYNEDDEIEYVKADLGKFTTIADKADYIYALPDDTDAIGDDALGISGTLGNTAAEQMINQIGYQFNWEGFTYLDKQQINDDLVAFIVRFNYDYYLIVAGVNGDSVTGYHDPTGYLASLYGEDNSEAEDLEYQRQLEEGLINDD